MPEVESKEQSILSVFASSLPVMKPPRLHLPPPPPLVPRRNDPMRPLQEISSVFAERLLEEVSSFFAKLPWREGVDDPTLPLPPLLPLRLLLLLMVPRRLSLEESFLMLTDELSRADVDAVTPTATSAPFTTDFLKFRRLRVGLCTDTDTKNIGQNIISRSVRVYARRVQTIQEEENNVSSLTEGRKHAGEGGNITVVLLRANAMDTNFG